MIRKFSVHLSRFFKLLFNFRKNIAFLMALGVALANRPYEGVNPDTLSCDPKGEIFLLLPDFTDCTIFYMCAHGKEELFHCSPGTIFDFELQGCDWEWSGTCTLRTPREELEGPEEEEEGSGEGTFEWHPELSRGKREAASLGDITADIGEEVSRNAAREIPIFDNILQCDRPQSASKLVPYRGDCQRYWRCVRGAPAVAFCSDGLYFNERTQQCDFEANAKCVDLQPDEVHGEFMLFKK